MSHAWLAVTHLTEDGYQRLVEERERKLATEEEDAEATGGAAATDMRAGRRAPAESDLRSDTARPRRGSRAPWAWRSGSLAASGVALPGPSAPLRAQQVQRLPLAPIPPKGEPVAPFFEGWYRNDDGSFTFSFGLLQPEREPRKSSKSRSAPDNFIEPAEFDGAQPTHFPVRPRRDRGRVLT